MKQKTTKDRIVNWARWARGGPAKPTGSMTGTICDNMRLAAMGSISAGGGAGGGVDRLDSEDAALVERAWRALQPKYRDLLRWHYIRSATPEFICRRMGIKPRPTNIFDIELTRAETEIGRMLRELANRDPSYWTSMHLRARGTA